MAWNWSRKQRRRQPANMDASASTSTPAGHVPPPGRPRATALPYSTTPIPNCPGHQPGKARSKSVGPEAACAGGCRISPASGTYPFLVNRRNGKRAGIASTRRRPCRWRLKDSILRAAISRTSSWEFPPILSLPQISKLTAIAAKKRFPLKGTAGTPWLWRRTESGPWSTICRRKPEHMKIGSSRSVVRVRRLYRSMHWLSMRTTMP